MLVLLTDYEKRKLEEDDDGVWNDVVRRMEAMQELALGACPVVPEQKFSAKGPSVWIFDSGIRDE